MFIIKVVFMFSYSQYLTKYDALFFLNIFVDPLVINKVRDDTVGLAAFPLVV